MDTISSNALEFKKDVCSIQWGKPLQNPAFLGQTEERDGQFPRVKLLVLINDDKYVVWENLMALKVIRLYFNKMQYLMGSQCSFLKKGSDVVCSIKSITILQRVFGIFWSLATYLLTP